MSEQEKLKDRLFGDPNKKVRNVNFTIDKRELAKLYGGTYIPGDFPPFDGHIDWRFSSYTEEERAEGLAKSMNDFLDAAEDPKRSRRILSDTDDWGNQLDEGHPDYMTRQERIDHVLLCRKMDTGVTSRYEYELVLEGFLPPAEGVSIQEYEDRWEEYQDEREEKGFGRYPRVDPSHAK